MTKNRSIAARAHLRHALDALEQIALQLDVSNPARQEIKCMMIEISSIVKQAEAECTSSIESER